ncbi:hypothetical protein FB107DRAFT_280030 [Schizophyllum commune]
MTSQSTLAFRIRPSSVSVDLQATPHTHVTLESSPFDTPLSVRRKIMSSSSLSKIAAPSLPRVRFSFPSTTLRGESNVRADFSDDDHRIMRGKYTRREGKVTQVYRKKWVILGSLVYITAARLIASITAARLLVPRPLQNPVVIPQSTRRLSTFSPTSTPLPDLSGDLNVCIRLPTGLDDLNAFIADPTDPASATLSVFAGPPRVPAAPKVQHIT